MFEWERWMDEGRIVSWPLRSHEPVTSEFRQIPTLLEKAGDLVRKSGVGHATAPTAAWDAATRMNFVGEDEATIVATLKEGPAAYERWLALHQLGK